jgi:hypothetical protein
MVGRWSRCPAKRVRRLPFPIDHNVRRVTRSGNLVVTENRCRHFTLLSSAFHAQSVSHDGCDFFLEKPYYSASATSGSRVPSSSTEKESNMKRRVLTVTVGGAAAALAVGVMWTAPSASASDFCDSLGVPAQVRDCNCGADNVPGTDEYQLCLHGKVAAPGPASPPAPAPPP